MRFMWGNTNAGECWHGEPAATCPACHPQRAGDDSPWLLVLGALVFMGWVFLAPDATRRQQANEQAQERRHRERIERMAPKAFPYPVETPVYDLPQLAAAEVR